VNLFIMYLLMHSCFFNIIQTVLLHDLK